ncbi:MAG: amidohydrolase family protein [Kangiellaceae bacterium]|nr:amidohydrolase family protein [Kangiellaceae bacterium]
MKSLSFTISQSKKWPLASLALIILLTSGAYLFFSNEINHMLGGNTKVVDTSRFRALSGPLAITNVNVLSADSQSTNPNLTVLVTDNKIESLGKGIIIPDNYHVINGTGQFLIPGLVDSHVHIKKSKNDLLLYIANGITQIAEMTGMKEHFRYREEIKAGAIGPNIYISSPKVTSQKGIRPTFRSWFEKRHQNFLTPLEGREEVRKFKSVGYDSIKMSSDLSAEIYFAINDEAQQLGIPVIGHLPSGLGMNDLYASGQSQLAHITSITQAEKNKFGVNTAKNSEAYLEYLRRNADQIAIELKDHGIVVASTVWLHSTLPQQDFDLARFLKTIELEYQNPGWIEGSFVSKGWLPGNNSYENPNNTDPESKRESEIYWESHNQAIAIVTQALVRNGVSVIAGTDAHGAAGVIAGFSLHKELETLNKMGLTNAQVLRSATLAPAQWMGSDAGKIEVGYRADLVLLKKNPLENISHTKSINAVIANGMYLDRKQLDNILEAVKDANNNSRKINIDEYID